MEMTRVEGTIVAPAPGGSPPLPGATACARATDAAASVTAGAAGPARGQAGTEALLDGLMADMVRDSDATARARAGDIRRTTREAACQRQRVADEIRRQAEAEARARHKSRHARAWRIFATIAAAIAAVASVVGAAFTGGASLAGGIAAVVAVAAGAGKAVASGFEMAAGKRLARAQDHLAMGEDASARAAGLMASVLLDRGEAEEMIARAGSIQDRAIEIVGREGRLGETALGRKTW